MDAVHACPCGSSQTYTDCCQPLHLGLISAKTAVQLMRSRYAAYVFKRIDYLIETTHPDKRSPNLRREIDDWAAQVEFYRLEIIRTQQGQPTDKVGKVEFIAYYRRAGKEEQFREFSRFRIYRKDWVYLDGLIEQ